MPDFFEVVRSQRGVRYYAPDPVQDDLVEQMIRAATWAPSGGNVQPWSFIVIRDTDIKRKLGEIYRAGGAAARGDEPPPPVTSDGPFTFGEDMTTVPVLIMCCMERGTPQGRATLMGASIFPAVQNLMLAATALGLGTRLTTIWQHKDDDVTALLGLPENVEAMALIPIGYPAPPDHLGGSKRKPIAEVIHYDRW